MDFCNRVFRSKYKVTRNAISAIKDFTGAKKLPPVGLELMITGSRDYQWFMNPVLNQLS